MQIFHVAQHEGQELLVAAHRVGGAERAKHAPARGEGFARRAERTILALALDHAAAQAERLAAQFFVAELRAGQQHGFQQLGRVHAAAQRAAEPRALLPGLGEDGRAAEGAGRRAVPRGGRALRPVRKPRRRAAGETTWCGAAQAKVRVNIKISSDIKILKKTAGKNPWRKKTNIV